MQEYSCLIQKMNSNESWAYSFVALYFAFLASIGTVTGFLMFADPSSYSPESALGKEVLLFSHSFSIRGALIGALASLGIALNTWAVFMVVDYKRVTRLLTNQLSRIEKVVHGGDASFKGFATMTLEINSHPVWRTGEKVVVGSVVVMFFAPWLIVLFSA